MEDEKQDSQGSQGVPSNTPDDLEQIDQGHSEGQEVNRLEFMSPENEIEEENEYKEEVEAWATGSGLDIKNIKPEPHEVIKVILLATPDMFEEQNRIMTDVRHRLEKYCKMNHKMEFQIMAPHWHPGMEEQKYSAELIDIGLSILNEADQSKFCIPVLLLGEKYGWCPPPNKIPRREFEFLIRHLRRIDINGPTYLRNYYVEDKNEDPPVCVLRKNYKSPEPSQTQEVDSKGQVQMEDSYQTLSDTLKVAARSALDASHIKEEEYNKYATSVVDVEITEGILPNQTMTDNCLCFVKKIQNLEEHCTGNTRANKYCDLTPDLKIDKEARERIKHLTDVVVPSSFPEAQVFNVHLPVEQTAISLDLDSREAKYHTFLQKMTGGKRNLVISQYHQHVQQFANMVEGAVISHLDALMETVGDTEKSPQEIKNVLFQHWRRASEIEAKGVGMEEESQRIMAYLSGISEQAMVIFGETGIGKTSLMCKFAVSLIEKSEAVDDETKQADGEIASDVDSLDAQPIVALRLLDKAWGPWTVDDLLWSVAQQINIALGRGFLDDDQKYLAEDYFYEALDLATSDKPIYLLLDSVDHLITPITMEAMGWLPDVLPPNVKVVLSVATDTEDNLFDDIQQKIIDDDNFLEVDVLDEAESFKIIQRDLTHRKRGISDKQAMFTALLLQGGAQPVFLDLFSIIISEWTSSIVVDPNDPAVLDSADGIIMQYIEKLESTHGELLVAHALSYISLAQVGLTHNELIDILSIDDILLSSEIFPTSKQPSPRRFPEIAWLRLLWDIRAFLAVIQVDGVTAYRWTNRRFKEGVHQRYLVDLEHVTYIHHNMADYFLGTFSGNVRKEFLFDAEIVRDEEGNEIERKMLQSAKESRWLPLQPTIYQAHTHHRGPSVANFRKMTEMPFHLLHSDRLQELRQTVLFNYSWWYARIKFGSLDALVEDLEKILESPQMISDQELEMVIETLQDCRQDLDNNLDYLRCELTARLMQYLGTHSHIGHLIKTCDHHGYYHCRLTPMSPYSEALADEITHALPIDTGFDGHVVIATTSMPDFIVSYTVTNRLSVRNVRSGDKVGLECSENAYYSSIRTSNLRNWVYAVNDTKTKYTYQDDTMAVDIFDLDEGAMVNRIMYDHGDHTQKVRKLFKLTCLRDRDIIYETSNHVAICFGSVHLYNLNTGEEVGNNLPWPHLLTADEQLLLVIDPDGEGVMVKEFPQQRPICRLTAPKHVTAMTCIERGTEMYLLTAAGSSGALSLFDLQEVMEGNDLDTICTGVINDGKRKSSKGGVGHFILSPYGRTAIAIYLYSIGTKINQENYLIDTERLNIMGQYKCNVGEIPSFSSDERYVLHLRKYNDIIEIMDAGSLISLATFSPGPAIFQALSSPAAGQLLVVTKEYVLEVDVNKVVKKSELKKLCQKVETDEVEKRKPAKQQKITDSIQRSNKPSIGKHALLADLDRASSSSLSDLEQKLSVKVMTLNLELGLVDSNTRDLMRGVHFSEFDLPSFTSDLMLTPDGKNLILLCDQVHIWNPVRSTVLLALPLKDKSGYTRLFVKDPGTKNGNGPRKDIFVKDVTMEGLTLEKGAFVFRDLGARHQVLYEAKGGEIIQRIPSVARAYDIITGQVTSIVRVQNERLVTCNESLLVTSAQAHCFTNLYSFATGEQFTMMDFRAKLALFTADNQRLLLVSNGQQQFLRIHMGEKYQNANRIKLADHSSELIEEITLCPADDDIVVVSVYKPHDESIGMPAKTFYLRINLEDNEILSRAQLEGIVHISSDGTLAVDHLYTFYDIITGNTLFKMDPIDITLQGRPLASHMSYLTDDGHHLVCLDTTRGLIIVIDVRGRRVLTSCPYHTSFTTMEKLKGKVSITSLIPLYGGYECVVLDGGGFVKQFALQTFESLRNLGNKDSKHHDSIRSRAQFFQSHYNHHVPVNLSKYLPNLRHTRAVDSITIAIKPGYLGPIIRQ